MLPTRGSPTERVNGSMLWDVLVRNLDGLVFFSLFRRLGLVLFGGFSTLLDF